MLSDIKDYKNWHSQTFSLSHATLVTLQCENTLDYLHFGLGISHEMDAGHMFLSLVQFTVKVKPWPLTLNPFAEISGLTQSLKKG
jgi:hypothetical protein